MFSGGGGVTIVPLFEMDTGIRRYDELKILPMKAGYSMTSSRSPVSTVAPCLTTICVTMPSRSA
jgi:hypothetical protein